MNTNSFIANIKAKDIYADTEKHSAANIQTTITDKKNSKVIALIK